MKLNIKQCSLHFNIKFILKINVFTHKTQISFQTFQGRFRRIMDGSQNALHTDLTNQINMLDESERRLFAAGQRGLLEFQSWESRESEKLSTSSVVLNQRKRKWVGACRDSGD